MEGVIHVVHGVIGIVVDVVIHGEVVKHGVRMVIDQGHNHVHLDQYQKMVMLEITTVRMVKIKHLHSQLR